MNFHGNITVVIRSAEERTEQLCRELILSQGVPENDLFTVREVPFSAAMRKSFEIGVEQNRRWTFCVDADVLLRPGAVEQMYNYAEAQSENVCEIQGYVMDKFFGGPRQAGNHLFRTSLLPEVIRRIPEEGVDIRPERYTLGQMAKAGYPWEKVPCIVGLHDSGQYNFDIYRKAFVQAVKHLERAELFIRLWKEKSQEDPDYEVALRGFTDSILNNETAYINRNQQLYRDLYHKAGFSEKSGLSPSEMSPDDVEKIIREWEYPDIYFTYFPTRDGLDNKNQERLGRVKRSLGKRGVIKTLSLITGGILSAAGNRLRNI